MEIFSPYSFTYLSFGWVDSRMVTEKSNSVVQHFIKMRHRPYAPSAVGLYQNQYIYIQTELIWASDLGC